MDARRAAAIATGAVVGSSLRWTAVRALGPDGLDAALLLVNVAGCLLLGLVSQLPPRELTSRTEAFLGAGLCGSLTTWSSLALRTASELRGGAWTPAGSWLLVNVAVGVAAAAIGRYLGRTRWQHSKRAPT